MGQRRPRPEDDRGGPGLEAEYPNITIETESADFGPYFDRLGTQISGGDAPDVFQINDNSLATFVVNGTLMDLETVSDILDTSEIPPAVLDTGRVDGLLAVVPMGVSPWGVVIVNTELLAQSGVTLPDDKAWTWEEYAEAGAQITAALGDGLYGIDSFAFESFNLALSTTTASRSSPRRHCRHLAGSCGLLVLRPRPVRQRYPPPLRSTSRREYGRSAYRALGTAAMAMAGTTWSRASARGGRQMELRRALDGEGSCSTSRAWRGRSRRRRSTRRAPFVDWPTNSGTVRVPRLRLRLAGELARARRGRGHAHARRRDQVEFSNAVASRSPRPRPTARAGSLWLMIRYGELRCTR